MVLGVLQQCGVLPRFNHHQNDKNDSLPVVVAQIKLHKIRKGREKLPHQNPLRARLVFSDKDLLSTNGGNKASQLLCGINQHVHPPKNCVNPPRKLVNCLGEALKVKRDDASVIRLEAGRWPKTINEWYIHLGSCALLRSKSRLPKQIP